MSFLGTLIFDMDGTLVDAMEQHAHAFSRILERYGIPRDFSKKLYLNTAGEPLDQQFKLALNKYGVSEPPDLQDLIGTFWILVQETEPKLFPDVLDAIKTLHQAGYILVITSGCAPTVVRSKMTKAGLAGYFKLLLGTDYTAPAMSKGEGHFKIIQNKLCFSSVEFSENSALIGDGKHDMEIAHRAGILAIGRITDANEDELKRAGADFIVSTLDQLVALLQSQSPTSDDSRFLPVRELRRKQK